MHGQHTVLSRSLIKVKTDVGAVNALKGRVLSVLSIMEVQQFVLIEVDIHSGFVFTVLSAPAITTIYLWFMHILHTPPSTERLMYHIDIYYTQRPFDHGHILR